MSIDLLGREPFGEYDYYAAVYRGTTPEDPSTAVVTFGYNNPRMEETHFRIPRHLLPEPVGAWASLIDVPDDVVAIDIKVDHTDATHGADRIVDFTYGSDDLWIDHEYWDYEAGADEEPPVDRTPVNELGELHPFEELTAIWDRDAARASGSIEGQGPAATAASRLTTDAGISAPEPKSIGTPAAPARVGRGVAMEQAGATILPVRRPTAGQGGAART